MIRVGNYRLRCPECGAIIDDHYTNSCPCGCNSLIRAEYVARRLTVRVLPGMFRFHDWLPVDGWTVTDAGPVTYRSENLASELGLSNLYITFNGYWPEKNACIRTCSFKKLEALPTMLRMSEKGKGILQIASAGNTGRAFAQISAESGVPVVIVVPKSARDSIWTTRDAGNVCLITVDGDYSDAISLGNELCRIDGIVPEEGAKNPARRDGMGTVMLDAAVSIGRMPDWYFQAIGSGTGGIAAWEMALRLAADGRYGQSIPRLFLSQNEPFAPMVNAWNAGRREIIPELDMPDAESAIKMVYSPVLTNRNPPYSIKGGVFDALAATNGEMRSVLTDDAKSAGKIFEDLEGIDPDPAAAVCVASLISAVENNEVENHDIILLNITGGGYKRAERELERIPVIVSAHMKRGSAPGELTDDIIRWKAGYA